MFEAKFEVTAKQTQDSWLELHHNYYHRYKCQCSTSEL